MTARRLLTAAVQDDVQRLADAVGRLQEQRNIQSDDDGIYRHEAPSEMVIEADRLVREGLGISWPLDSVEILKALNSFIVEPEGQLLLEVDGEAIAPERPRKRCEECGGAGEPVKCGNCGKTQYLCREHTNTATDEDGSELEVCSECAEDLETCYNCDGLIFTDSAISIGNDNYCASCAEESSNCDDCGDRELDEDLTHIESADKNICNSCRNEYGYCERCNEYHHHDDMRDSSLCDECWSEEMTECEECGTDIRRDDANIDDDTGAPYCDDCFDGGNLHEDATDLGVEFDRGIKGDETPLSERLGMLLRIMGEKGRMSISQLKKSHPGLASAIMSEYDVNRLSDGNSFTKEKVKKARDALEEKYEGLRVSVGEWSGDQRLYRKDNLVFRLDVRDMIDEMEERDGSAGETSEDRAAVSLLEVAANAGMGAHPVIPKSTIGWARVVPFGDTWYVEELQSDFDFGAGAIKKYVKDKGKTVSLPSGVSAEDVRVGWPLVSDLLDNWEQHLLAKLAEIARENGVKTLAIISKSQLDAWKENPPGRDYSVSGKTRSNTKRKRYYRDAPKSMGFDLKDEEIGGLQQKVWLRAASMDGLFERMARLAAFEASLGFAG